MASITETDMMWIKSSSDRKKPKSDNSNAVFVECCKYTKDDYWINKLKSASKGKFPKNIRFCDGCLVYRKKNKMEKIHLSHDPKTRFQQIKEFYHKYGVRLSSSDIDSQKKIRDDALSVILQIDSWKSVKRPKLKRVLIYEYAKRKTEEMGLYGLFPHNMVDVISIGIDTKSISNDDIVMADGKIHKIDGIEFDGKIFRISRHKIDSIQNKNQNVQRPREYYIKPGYDLTDDKNKIDIDRIWSSNKETYENHKNISNTKPKPKANPKKRIQKRPRKRVRARVVIT